MANIIKFKGLWLLLLTLLEYTTACSHNESTKTLIIYNETINLPVFDIDILCPEIGPNITNGIMIIETIIAPNLVTINGNPFTHNSLLWVMHIKYIHMNSLINITVDNLFSGFFGLETVSLLSLKSITGDATFNQCAALTSIYLPSLESITGNETFIGCFLVTKIELPSLKTIIGHSSFMGSKFLKILDLHSIKKVDILKNIAYYIKMDDIPDDDYAEFVIYPACYFLDFLNLSAYDGVIQEAAFANCELLKQIDISSVTQIPTLAFQNCYALNDVVIPNSCTHIGQRAFENTASLTTINISANTIVDSSAFLNSACPISNYKKGACLQKCESCFQTHTTTPETPTITPDSSSGLSSAAVVMIWIVCTGLFVGSLIYIAHMYAPKGYSAMPNNLMESTL